MVDDIAHDSNSIVESKADDDNTAETRHPRSNEKLIPAQSCDGLGEVPSATEERFKLLKVLQSSDDPTVIEGFLTPTMSHILRGLACTIGSAIGEEPPSEGECLAAFLVPNSAGLTAGARAWSKHAHRSERENPEAKGSAKVIAGWWGQPRGPTAARNERALELFWKVWGGATWRNLHWLPHEVLAYEIRVQEGYGMRWSQDRSSKEDATESPRPWTFRGFVEPMMENGHELGWRH